MPQDEIIVQLNGQKVSFAEGQNILRAIQYLIPDSPFVAVEYNGQILEKNDYLKTIMRDGDILEIIQPLGGGSR